MQQSTEFKSCLEKHYIILKNCFKIYIFLYGFDVNRAIAMSPPYTNQTNHWNRKKKNQYKFVIII